MRLNLPRHLVPVTLVAAILIAPLPAAAAPRDFGWGAVVGWATGLLRHLWAEEGASCDPLGRPETAPAATADGGRHLWAEEGVSIDPWGRPLPASEATADDGRQ